MLEELRWNPWSLGARSCGRRPAEPAVRVSARVGPSLSTGFTEGIGACSTGIGRSKEVAF